MGLHCSDELPHDTSRKTTTVAKVSVASGQQRHQSLPYMNELWEYSGGTVSYMIAEHALQERPQKFPGDFPGTSLTMEFKSISLTALIVLE